MIYLDNNATTIMPVEVQKEMLNWCNRGNPSSGYPAAQESRAMMDSFREYIGKLCGVYTGNAAVKTGLDYKVIFTSGASESNCMLLSSVVSAYSETIHGTPHIVMSAIEHKSLLDQAKSYEARGLVTVTFVNPTPSGHITPASIENAIKPNTCIVCVMHANNETGAVNDIEKIGAVAHKHNIPFHSDTVQTFGKFPLNPVVTNVDSFCVSFHKFHGPPGVGALIIKGQLLRGYKLQPMIFGSQNGGLRGGTENLPGIGAAYMATKMTMTNRTTKNAAILKTKKYIMAELAARIPTQQYTTYLQAKGPKPEIEVVFLSDSTSAYLPNTIFLSVVKRTKPYFCNSKMREHLEKRGIVISVGSACNTSSEKASHVLYSLGADELIRKGALRISLGDETTLHDAKKFIIEFLKTIKLQV